MPNIFRNVPDATDISIPLWLHIVILVIFIGGFFVIKAKKSNPYLEPVFVTLLIAHQCLLYGWYILSKYHTLTEGLPLFHCRLAILFLTIYYFTKSKVWAQLGVQIGLLGSMISLTVFVPDPFLFPHITQLTYVFGHAVLGWYAWYILITHKQLFTLKALRHNNVIILIINMTLIAVDYILPANYGFFMTLPLFPPPHSLIFRQFWLLVLFNTATYCLGYLFMKFQQKRRLT